MKCKGPQENVEDSSLEVTYEGSGCGVSRLELQWVFGSSLILVSLSSWTQKGGSLEGSVLL